jgi:hypothetical protein
VRRIIRKVTYGWYCDPCMLGIAGRQDALVHMGDTHHIPQDFIREESNGDLFDMRSKSVVDRMRDAGQ